MAIVTDQIELVRIPEGVMPTADDSKSFRRPDYSGESLPSFYLGKYAVTAQQWVILMDYLPLGFEDLSPNHPVFNVSFIDVQRFIKKLNKLTGLACRLPTEREWEYAARAGHSHNLPISRGELFSGKYVNFDKKVGDPIPVGSLPPNDWGCYEMLGNLWEWVSNEGCQYSNSPLRVLKGGCWASSYHDVGFSNRAEHDAKEVGWDTFGFRLLLPMTRSNGNPSALPQVSIEIGI